ncbi:hypothetical protein V6N13_124288 [Hibiscus sabdariffa]
MDDWSLTFNMIGNTKFVNAPNCQAMASHDRNIQDRLYPCANMNKDVNLGKYIPLEIMFRGKSKPLDDSLKKQPFSTINQVDTFHLLYEDNMYTFIQENFNTSVDMTKEWEFINQASLIDMDTSISRIAEECHRGSNVDKVKYQLR